MKQVPSRENRILVIDDNALVHNDFRKILSSESREFLELNDLERLMFDEEEPTPLQDYQLDFAFQGQEALELARRAAAEGQPYKLAFVDMRMPPGWDGLQTMVELRKVDSNLQFVVCSAYSDFDPAQIAETLGVRASLLHLPKPFSLDEVRQVAFLFGTRTDAHLS
jgi:CheY-like chemotaxis protein